MTLLDRFCRLRLALCAGLLLAIGSAAGAPLRVAFDAVVKPVAFVDEQGKPAGFAADYLRAIAREAGFEIELIAAHRGQLWSEFEAGRVDVIAVLVFTEERAKTMDFSLPYLELAGAVFARKGGPALVTTADLAGRKVAVSRGNVTHTYLMAHPEWGAVVVPVDSTEAALRAVNTGECDAAVNIDLVARDLIRERGLDGVVRTPVELPGLVYKYHMAVRHGETALLRRLNEAHFILHERGEFARLYEKWIGPLKPRELTSRELQSILVPALGVFVAALGALFWQRRNLRLLGRQAAELREGQQRLGLVLQSGRHSLWDWDIPNNRVQRGPMLAEILGYAPGEIPATHEGLAALLHPDDKPELQRLSSVVRRHGAGDFSGEIRIRTKSGEWMWIATVGRVVERDTSGSAIRALGTHTDINARKLAEEGVRHLNLELERRVAERTAELSRRTEEAEQFAAELRTSQQMTERVAGRLQQTNAELVLANQELEAFSYSVSHDLRTPLRNIGGFLELLEQRSVERLDAESRRFVSVVVAESARMGGLIDDLLAFSRIGRAELKVAPVALDAIIAEVREELRPQTVERVIEWQIGPIPPVRGDPELLRLVVANLLGNAVKFSRRRAVATIEVGAVAVDGDAAAPHVTIRVRDNGAGFNPKYQEKLFGVFQRLHNAREFEGTGIGLANVKRIVDRHGGRVWAEGAVEQGAAFYFTLAVVRDS